MAQAFALHDGTGGPRMRVHTPGKYIVLFLFAPVVLVAIGSGLWLSNAERRAAFAGVEYRQSLDGAREAYYPIPEFLVDLRMDDAGRTAYLRLKVSIRLDSASLNDAVEQVDAVKPAVIERLALFLRELRPEDFDGSENMARIKSEMLRRVNLALSPHDARDVVIEDLIIQ